MAFSTGNVRRGILNPPFVSPTVRTHARFRLSIPHHCLVPRVIHLPGSSGWRSGERRSFPDQHGEAGEAGRDRAGVLANAGTLPMTHPLECFWLECRECWVRVGRGIRKRVCAHARTLSLHMLVGVTDGVDGSVVRVRVRVRAYVRARAPAYDKAPVRERGGVYTCWEPWNPSGPCVCLYL